MKMENEKFLLKIHDYLSEEMSEGDRFLFEKELNENPELSLLFEEIKESWETIEQEYSDQKILDDYPNPTSEGANRFNFKYLGLAAGIVIIVLAGIYYWSPFSNPSLFDKEFKPHPGIRVIMGDSKKDLAEGMSLYRSGEYLESKSYFLKLYHNSVINDTISFFLGNISLIDKEFAEASDYLEQVLKIEDSRFADYSQWYLALIDVGQKDWKASRVSLSQIVVSNSEFSERAESLLLSIPPE